MIYKKITLRKKYETLYWLGWCDAGEALRSETEKLAAEGVGCVIYKKITLRKEYETLYWQGRRDSNTQPTVLETATLPLSHSPKTLLII